MKPFSGGVGLFADSWTPIDIAQSLGNAEPICAHGGQAGKFFQIMSKPSEKASEYSDLIWNGISGRLLGAYGPANTLVIYLA